ncbi:MAG: glycosyltransferase [Polyangiaceae bacterium]|nr:glycosyltransferase [Polyangiaceae bacterium]
MIQQSPTVALVLETCNLRGGNAEKTQRVPQSLIALFQLFKEQTFSLSHLNEFVLTHDGLDTNSQDQLSQALGRPIRFVEISPTAGYYDAKNSGFDATTADIVVFADADCLPKSTWLEKLLKPFSNPDVQVTAGRTTYKESVLGSAATSIDFMYFPSSLGPDTTRNFYANNVAFRRAVFAQFRYQPAPGIYRGHCQRLGIALHKANIAVHFVPEAHTVHRFPDTTGELLHLRLLRGADTVEMAPALANAVLPKPLQWVGRTGPIAPLTVLGARLFFSERALGHQDMAPLSRSQTLLARAAVVGITALDAAGALSKSVFKNDFGVHNGALTRNVLGYHANANGYFFKRHVNNRQTWQL